MPKTKNDSPRPMRALPFALGWAFVTLINSLIGLAYGQTDIARTLTVQQALIIAILRATPLPALFQVLLVERLFKLSMRGWLVYTLIGTLITTWLALQRWPNGLATSVPIMSLALFVPVMLLQTAWLWQRVKKAWLWPLASLLVFGITRQLSALTAASQPLQLIVPFGISLLMGFLMHFLLSHPKDTQKAKNDAAADDSALDQARLARLQEADERDIPWIEDITKGSQQEA